MATTKRTTACRCITGPEWSGSPTPDEKSGWFCDDCGRFIPAEDYTERPVVVGEVWEGVLEHRVVVVETVTERGCVARDLEGSDAVPMLLEAFTLAEFRER